MIFSLYRADLLFGTSWFRLPVLRVIRLLMLAVAACGAIFFSTNSFAQTVSLIGWDAPATLVSNSLSSPSGVAADYNGAIYIADTANKRVIQLVPSGTGYQAGATLIDATTTGGGFQPVSVAVDPALNVYVYDAGAGRVIEIPWNGSGFGTATTIASGFTGVSKVVVDGGENVYVADYGNHTVYQVARSGSAYGTPAVIASSGYAGSSAIAVDAGLNLYFTDSTGSAIVESAWNGSAYSTPISLVTGLSSVQDIAIDSGGNLFFIAGGTVESAARLGSNSFGAPFSVGGSSTFAQASGLAFGSLGTLLVADKQANTVSSVLPPGNFGSLAIGTFSPTRNISFRFNTGANLGSQTVISAPESPNVYTTPYDFLDNGGSCGTGFYNPGDVCTLAIGFWPHHAGALAGVLALYGTSGPPLISVPLTGSGVGAQIAFAPTQSNFPIAVGPNQFAFDGNNNLYYAAFSGASGSVKEAVWNGNGFNTPKTLLSGVFPIALALDAAGNVYVADAPTTSILKIPATTNPGGLLGGTFGQPVTLWVGSQPQSLDVTYCGTTISLACFNVSECSKHKGSCVTESYFTGTAQSLTQMTVDVAGNVYFQAYTTAFPSTGTSIVNLGATLMKLPITSSGYGAPQIIAPPNLDSIFSSSQGYLPLAVDLNGNIFIGSPTTGSVFELHWSANGYSAPDFVLGGIRAGLFGYFIAVDGNDNVYATSGSLTSPVGSLIRAWRNGASWSSTTVVNLPNTQFQGLTLDAVGNPWVSSFSSIEVRTDTFSKLDVTSFPTLNFPTGTYVGQADTTDGPASVTLNNIGNQPLALNPVYPPSFPVNTGDPSLCQPGGTLAQGQSCNLSMSFSPVSSGTLQQAATPASGPASTANPGINLVGVSKAVLALQFGTAPPAALEAGQSAGSGITVLVEDFGGVVTTATPTVTLAVSGPNHYSATYTANAIAGVATFNLPAPLTVLGTYSYKATTAGYTTAYASENVVQGLVTSLAFGTPPTPVILTGQAAGSAITVLELNSAGALHTQAADSITLAVTGPGTYSAQYIQTAVGGVATFNLSAVPLNVRGTYTYTATTGSFSATATETVNPGVVTFGNLSVGSSSASRPAAVVFTLNVAARDGVVKVVTAGVTGKDFALASGGTCSFAPLSTLIYYVGQSCTVNVVFTPQAPGLRTGAVEIFDGNSDLVGEAFLSGTGVAPQIAFRGQLGPVYSPAPPVYSLNAVGLAVDGGGNVWEADPINSNVLRIPWNGSAYGNAVTEGDINPQYGTPVFWSPGQIALDGGGSVYVAQGGMGGYGPPAVVKMSTILGVTGPICCGPEQFLGSGWQDPQGVAVDTQGNVYVADAGNGNIFELPWTGTGYAPQVQIAQGLYATQLAVDGSGDVFAAAGLNGVYEISPATRGFTAPIQIGSWNAISIAVDGSGNLFIDDDNLQQIVRLPWTGSAFGAPAAVTAPGTASGGVAVDAAGTVYLGNASQPGVMKAVTANPPAFKFAQTTIAGTTDTVDGAQTATLSNIGNQALTFTATPAYPVNFPANTADASLCSASVPLGQGASCDISANFMPQAAGALSANVVLNDNSITGTTQSIPVTGSAVVTPPFGAQILYGGTQSSQTSYPLYPGGQSIVAGQAPLGLSFDSAGNLYVGDGTYFIDQWNRSSNKDGSYSFTFGNQLETDYFNGDGTEFALDNAGNFYYPSFWLFWGVSSYNPFNPVYTAPHNQIVFENSAQIGKGLDYPTAVALDPSQTHLYVADGGLNSHNLVGGSDENIWKMTAPFGSGAAFSPILAISGTPLAIAVDRSGNIYLDTSLDFGNDNCQELEFSPTATGTYTQAQISTHCSYGLSVQDDGTIYIADQFSGNVMHQTPVGGGGWVEFALAKVNGPVGLAVDPQGNVWVSDSTDGNVVELTGTTTNLGETPLGSTKSATLNFTVVAGVTLGRVGILTWGQPGLDFTDAGQSTCTPQTYLANTLCVVNINFTPSAPGPRGGAVVLYDQNGNPITSVILQGTGVGPVPVFESPAISLLTPTANYFNSWGATALDGAGNLYIPVPSANEIMFAAPQSAATVLPLSSPTASPNPAQPSANSTLNNPLAAAIDPAGTLYIADSGNNRILVRQPTGTTGGYYLFNLATKGFTLSGPEGVATDAGGDVFIADTGNNRILEVLRNGSARQFGPNVAQPGSVAVDPAGNVYFTYTVSPSAWKISSDGKTVTQLSAGSTGLQSPTGIAVDAAGTVYIADSKTGVLEVSAGGTVNTMNLPWPLAGYSNPNAISLDSAGNVYLSASGLGVYEMQRSGLSLSFVSTKTGVTSTDSPRTVLAENVGNRALNITGVSYPLDFPQGTTVSNACTNSTQLTPGGACNLPISFQPSSGTSLSEQVTLTDNAFNVAGASQSIAVNGTGVAGGLSQTITSPLPGGVFTKTPSYPYSIGGPLVYISASSGLPVTLTVVSGPGTFGGASSSSTSHQLSFTAAGVVKVLATQPGNATYAPAPPAMFTVTATAAPISVNTRHSSFTQVYGAASPTVVFLLSGLVNVNDQVYLTITGGATPASPVGNDLITFGLTGPMASSYYLAAGSTTGTLVVSPAPLTVAATDVYVTAGQAIPALGYTLIGLAPGDTPAKAVTGTPVLSTTATATNAGSYPIALSLGSLTSTNYTLTPANGVLNVFAPLSMGSVAVNGTPASRTLSFGQGPASPFANATGTTFAAGQNMFQAGSFACSSGTCTGTITFAPTLPGNWSGSIQLTDQSIPAHVLVSIPVSGNALAPRIAFVPGRQSTIGTGLNFPTGVAIDSTGNTYIADQQNNRVVKVLVNGGGQIALGSGLNQPSGLAVDSTGNLWIADTGNGRIVQVPAAGGSQIVVASGFNRVSGIAVDAAGDLYAADSGAGTVQMFPAGGGAPVPVGNGWISPVGIALDALGDVFVTDAQSNKLVEVSGGQQTSLPVTGLNSPAGVAVDQLGDIFLSDTLNGRILELPANGAAQFPLQSGPTKPSLLAVTPRGILYVPDPVNNRVLTIDPTTPPALTFAPTALNTAASAGPQTVTVMNQGNSNLTFSAVQYPDSFPESSGVSTDCTASTSLIPGGVCTLSIQFSPRAANVSALNTPVSSSILVTDNNLNTTAAQSVPVTGTPAAAALAVTESKGGSFALGATGLWNLAVANTSPFVATSGTVTLTANMPTGFSVVRFSTTSAWTCNGIGTLTLTCTASQAVKGGNFPVIGVVVQVPTDAPTHVIGKASVWGGGDPIHTNSVSAATTSSAVTTATEPSQTITFLAVSVQTVGTPLTLSATASSGLAVTFTSATTSVCTVSGVTATFVTSGTCTITANQVGNNTYAAAPQVQQTFAVTGKPQTITFTALPATVAFGSAGPYTLKATASSALPVSFSATGPATLSSNILTLTGVGTVVVTASQAGNTKYAPAAPVAQTMLVNPPANPTLSAASSLAFSSLAFGSSKSLPLTIKNTGGGKLTVSSISIAGRGYSASLPSCAPSIASGASCAVNVTFAPAFLGQNTALLTLVSNGGNATVALTGTSTGPQVAFFPAPQQTVGSGWVNPIASALDSHGNLYVADGGQSSILKLPGGGGTPVNVGTGLNQPDGVAVDGSGNLYISDSGNHRVVEFPANGAPQIVLASGLTHPAGIAVDGNGNVYFADLFAPGVYKIPAAGGSPIALGTGWSSPFAVAVDTAGNVFVSDNSANQVVELPAGGGPQISLLNTGLNYPSGLAIDAVGNLYVSDTLHSRILVLLANGGLQIPVVASGLKYPYMLSVDGAGNLYIPDAGVNKVFRVSTFQPPSLSFASTAVGATSTDSPKFVTLYNPGNVSLVFSGLAVPANFAESAGNGAYPACTATSTIQAGAACQLPISFTPAATGSLSGALVLSDNSRNTPTAQQSIHVSGTATVAVQKTAISAPASGKIN